MGAHYIEQFVPSSCAVFTFLKKILSYESIASAELRRKRAKEIFDKCIFADMLAMSPEALPKEVTDEISDVLKTGQAPFNVFDPVKERLYRQLHEMYMKSFSKSDPYIRFCQWKYMELATPEQISLNDFSIHRIIGRGGFGEVYGCRKDDSGKM